MIAIACDHTGIELKDAVMRYLDKRCLKYKDYGTFSSDSCDYTRFAYLAAKAVSDGECDRGILICGTGVGISIAANKVKGIRCAVCSEPYSALLSKRHNNTNMLAVGARVIGTDLALMIIESWLDGEFEGGRHADRIEHISMIERGEPLI